MDGQKGFTSRLEALEEVQAIAREIMLAWDEGRIQCGDMRVQDTKLFGRLRTALVVSAMAEVREGRVPHSE